MSNFFTKYSLCQWNKRCGTKQIKSPNPCLSLTRREVNIGPSAPEQKKNDQGIKLSEKNLLKDKEFYYLILLASIRHSKEEIPRSEGTGQMQIQVLPTPKYLKYLNIKNNTFCSSKDLDW